MWLMLSVSMFRSWWLRFLFLVVSLSACSSPALAQWAAKAEAGVILARGNTTTDSANMKFDFSREFIEWKHAAGFTGVYASDETGATSQRWEARQQTDYRFHPKGFWFESGRYEEDRFSGVAYQATIGTGLGWRFFDTEITKLVAQIGAGYKASETRATVDDDGIFIPAERNEELIGQFNLNYEHQLTETTKVVEKFLVESGADSTFLQNDLSIQVKIMNSLALAAGYSVRYNNHPPDGFTATDTLTTLNLVYELK
jgi:putative salt-induced outer membrane protein